jgi:hypothetical protein
MVCLAAFSIADYASGWGPGTRPGPETWSTISVSGPGRMTLAVAYCAW